MKKRFLFLLCLALVAVSLPRTARAQSQYDVSVFTERDFVQEPELTDAIQIMLDGTTVTCDSSTVHVAGSTVTITEEGIYHLSGILADGQICIDAGKKDKVQLVLDGVQIASADSASIYVQQAGKVFLTLQGENTLENGGSYREDSNIDAVVFSKADLTMNGSGSLTVISPAGHGIVSKDSLKITGGSYHITAAEHGMTGKDLVAIADGSFAINAGTDGIHVKNADAELGSLYIAGGSFTVTSGDDGISATGNIQIDGGSFMIQSGGGSENGSMKPSDAFGSRGGWGYQTGTDEDSFGKGIKAAAGIMIQDGTFHLDCADDALHCDGEAIIQDGNFEIRTADDAIHAGADVRIDGGSFSIPYCYEGMEGENITINGGTIDIVSTDDGINASGGADGSGFRGGPQFGGDGSAITINGGEITIVSDGDSLDANGTIILNGGKLNLTCNGNGNTAIDYDSGYENNGAEVTTNDGSENGTGMMFGHGGRGHWGGQGDFGGRGQFDGQDGFGGRGQQQNGMPSDAPQPPEGQMDFGGQMPTGGPGMGQPR